MSKKCVQFQFVFEKRGCEKAVLHQVIRTANQKQLLMFLIWLDLLPQI
ncbi:hypothetical protein HMPREF9525_02905 [Enterococcus faecium TX0133a04]|nr:hypothetical protein HMPREF9525_02905 [Enterococcus faecium TX0133a04]